MVSKGRNRVSTRSRNLLYFILYTKIIKRYNQIIKRYNQIIKMNNQIFKITIA